MHSHVLDTAVTPLDLLLWHLLNFSISCCREIFCKKWLRNTQRKFTSTEAPSHHQTTARGCDTGRDQTATGREISTPSQQPHRPSALPCTQGGHNTEYWLYQIGQTNLTSRQHSVQQGTHSICGHRSRRPGPSPTTHSVFRDECVTHCSPLQKQFLWSGYPHVSLRDPYTG